MSRTAHGIAIILALSPLAAVVGWDIVLIGIALGVWLLVAGYFGDIIAWLERLEAEGL
jgi:hypothetical protein